MEAYSNPYWDEIKDRLDEVTDGMNLSIGLPPRREMYQMSAGKMMDLLTRNPYQRMGEIDPAAYMERYNRSLYHRRNDFCSKYCWAIPDPVTLDFLVQWCGPSLVEIGAGTGYFANQLSQRGVQVHAYDIAPPHTHFNNWYHSPVIGEHREFAGLTREVYFPVEVGTPETLPRHAESTLFLCWPPMSDMAVECLKYYRGNRLIYIGEDDGGCTADEAFFACLEKEWHEVAERHPVQWDGIHDEVIVFERGVEGQFTLTGEDGMELILPIKGKD